MKKSKMWKSVMKSLLVLAGTTVAVPYVITSVSSVLYGWSERKNKVRRTLNPFKVIAFSYTLLQMMHTKLRYIPLYIQWKQFYSKAKPSEVLKNLSYGRNEETLDLYLPQGKKGDKNIPVVVFVSGGAWSMKNKEMYGLLCSELANKLQAVVCCPNYSAYPKGYVDDMIQDVVDCLCWINDNAGDYGGDKDQLMLIGHSSGAHLCIMAILELLHDDILSAEHLPISESVVPQIHFEESHYKREESNGQSGLDGSSGSSGSFCVLDNGDKKDSLEASNTSSTYEVLKKPDPQVMEESVAAGYVKPMLDTDSEKGETELVESDKLGEITESKQSAEDLKDGRNVQESEEEDVGSEHDSVITVRSNDRQRTLVDIGKSVKAVIGIAGVYHIGDHYEHETSRGVEDVSCMARVMYGESHFDRFSPTRLCHSLFRGVGLPKIVLLHGTEDYVVPDSSSIKFCDVLRDLYVDVALHILPGCDHYEICLDLMKPNRKFYQPVMGIILQTAKTVFTNK
uniref:Probable isoprenylcysteine alpha-carbonyl methylesterase ICME isoform X1 n=2 Tax=Crassostrea virginica TaxID=6565 RepID=A0A8B8CSP5_CRAVI|nr:probable isoprenylcysteine alpha-carbonyl methylesterase ICME isoform X1 [Crassostrea virginica]